MEVFLWANMTTEQLSPLSHQHGEIIQCNRGDRTASFRWDGQRQVYEVVKQIHTNGNLPPHTQILDKRLAEMIESL